MRLAFACLADSWRFEKTANPPDFDLFLKHAGMRQPPLLQKPSFSINQLSVFYEISCTISALSPGELSTIAIRRIDDEWQGSECFRTFLDCSKTEGRHEQKMEISGLESKCYDLKSFCDCFWMPAATLRARIAAPRSKTTRAVRVFACARCFFTRGFGGC